MKRLYHKGGSLVSPNGTPLRPELVHAIGEATRDLPPGYTAEIFSAADARSTGTANHPNGVALDLRIVDPNGNHLPAAGFDASLKIYEQLFQSVRIRAKYLFPGRNLSWIWGGAWISDAAGFGDRMHYQIHDPARPVSGASTGSGAYSPTAGIDPGNAHASAFMSREELSNYQARVEAKARADYANGVPAVPRTAAEAIKAASEPDIMVGSPNAKRFFGITATVFGGDSDPNNSAYDEHFITDTELGVALPFRFPSGPRPMVRVFNPANGKSVSAAIVDVGPWNINDPYWKSAARPQAETGTDMTGRRTNLAGIDLTPAAARAIGINGKGIVDWEFVGTGDDDDMNEINPQTQVTAPKLNPEVIAQLINLALPFLLEMLRNKALTINQQPQTDTTTPPVVVTPEPPKKTGLLVGIVGLIGSVIANAFGFTGSPMGPEATPTGQILPAIFAGVTALAATGIFGQWGTILSSVFSAFKNIKTK